MLAGEEPPAELEIAAGGARLVVDIANGQKTGAYLDQQRNRERVAAHARDADVLDAFSYTGGFAIACLHAGARGATLIDSSADALELAKRETAAKNGLPIGEVKLFKKFSSWRRMSHILNYYVANLMINEC